MFSHFQTFYYIFKVSFLRVGSRVSSSVQRNKSFVIHHRHVILERVSYAHVSVAVNLHIINFISIFITYTLRIYLQTSLTSDRFSFLRQSSLNVEKTFARQHVQILLLYEYSYFVTVSEHCCKWVVHVSLNLDNAIGLPVIFKISIISKVAHRESQRLYKFNVRRAELLLLLLMQLDERVLSGGDVGLIKNTLSLCVRSASFNTSILRSRYCGRYRTCNLTVISSQRKIDQSSIQIDDAYR